MDWFCTRDKQLKLMFRFQLKEEKVIDFIKLGKSSELSNVAIVKNRRLKFSALSPVVFTSRQIPVFRVVSFSLN